LEKKWVVAQEQIYREDGGKRSEKQRQMDLDWEREKIK
jgi:hypothetical protein